MKTVCILTLGWILFDSALTLKNIFGMGIAVVGMVIYSWAVEIEKRAKISPQPRDNISSEDVKLLGGGKESSGKDVELGESRR